MILISVPRSSRWVAKLWRNACRVTLFLIPASLAVSWNRRLSWRVVIGLPGRRPGNTLRAVDMLDLQPDRLAGAQAAAVAAAEQHARLEAIGDGQQAPRLVRAHHLRNLLRLAQVIDLGGKI